MIVDGIKYECTYFSVEDFHGNTHEFDTTQVTLQDARWKTRGRYINPPIRSEPVTAVVEITDVPETFRDGGALSCITCMRVNGERTTEVEVHRQRRSPTDDDGTETWVLEE